MNRFCSAAGVALLALVASACAHAQASVAPIVTPLEVPPPPPRVVAADPVETPVTVEVPEAIPSNADALRAGQTAPRPAPPAARPTDAPRTDTAGGAAADAAKPDETRTAPPLPLQTKPPQQEREVESRVSTDMKRANDMLNRIDYLRLTADARGQYDAAKGYIRQGEEELRNKNLLLASSLAEKALTIATQLSGR
jgi:hypothetical protein